MLTLSLGFRLYQWDNFHTGLHPCGICQKISAAWKVLKAHSEQHQVIAGGGAAPSLVDAATMTAPDGVSLQATLVMAQGPHKRMRVVLDTHLGWDHPSAQSMQDINKELL